MTAIGRWLGAKWDGSADQHRRILRGMAAVTLFAVLGKVASAAKEMAVAWRYGVSGEVDAYLFVFNLISWPVALWFSALVTLLIPLEARQRRDNPERLSHFRAELLGLTLILGVGLMAAVAIGLPPLLRSGWVGLPVRTADLALRMVPVMSWVTLFGLLAGLEATWLMSDGGHLNTLFEGVPALGILCAVLLVGGIEPLVWGTLAGTVAQVLCLAVGVGYYRAHHPPSFSLQSPEWSPFWDGFRIMMLSQAIMGLTTLVDQFFAARLGEGAISALGFAGRILSLVLGVGATVVTRATLPVFANAGAERALDVRHVARRWAQVMLLAGTVSVGVGWVAAPIAVHLLFERGTFTATDTATVTHLLRFGLLQMPFYFAGLVFVSLHSSRRHYRLLFASSALGLSVKAVMSYLLLPLLGVPGLVLAQAVVYAGNALLLALVRPKESTPAAHLA